MRWNQHFKRIKPSKMKLAGKLRTLSSSSIRELALPEENDDKSPIVFKPPDGSFLQRFNKIYVLVPAHLNNSNRTLRSVGATKEFLSEREIDLINSIQLFFLFVSSSSFEEAHKSEQTGFSTERGNKL